jgi:hypothetical protein
LNCMALKNFEAVARSLYFARNQPKVCFKKVSKLS